MTWYGNGIPLHATGREKAMDRRKVKIGLAVSSEQSVKGGPQ